MQVQIPAFSGGFNLPSREAAELAQARTALAEAETELAALQQELGRFEADLDARLGPLLDQLSMLDAEVQALTAQVKDLRENRLFGEHRAIYYGAGFTPLPDPVITSEAKQSPFSSASDALPTDPQTELKNLYRRLARRFHPDLARSDADRAHCTEQMMVINQSYSVGNLGKLRELAGETAPPGAPDWISLHSQASHQPSELEQVQARLRQVRAQIDRLQTLPVLRLSLEAKLARHQGRSLLTEMSVNLQRKIALRIAERDYLQSQLEAAGN